MQGRSISFVVRASPPTESYPLGTKQEMMEANYEPHEIAFLRELQGLLDTDERRPALNSIHVIHELKALLGARIEEEEE